MKKEKMENKKNLNTIFVKSPLNYVGGKFKLLPKIQPFFPENVECFFDVFGGGFNVGVNQTTAKHIVYNDVNIYVVELLKYFKNNSVEFLLKNIESCIKDYQLSKYENGENGFYSLRNDFNKMTEKERLENIQMFYCLICFCFNHNIRFNRNNEFNSPFGRNKGGFNDKLRNRFIVFINRLHELKEISFQSLDFDIFFNQYFKEFEKSKNNKENDFFYLDPPYLISEASYNNKIGLMKGWDEETEKLLLNHLSTLIDLKVNFALSNVIEHKGKENELLKNWMLEKQLKHKNFNIHFIQNDYANSSYNLKNKGNKEQTKEILIVNNHIK